MSESAADIAPQPASKRSRKNIIIVFAAIAVLVIVAGVAALLLNRPGKFDTVGIMSLTGADAFDPTYDGGRCTPSAGYDDITEGTQVVVRDDGGSTVAVGTLDVGRLSDSGSTCDYEFTVTDVPGGSKFYEVEVGRRGGLQYTEDQLRSGVAVTLGS